jgi:hypothetical protein
MIMRRDPQHASNTLAHASIAVALGAATAACSGNVAPAETPPDASSDQSASIDEGVPDVMADQWQGAVFYGPAQCVDDAGCVGFQRDASSAVDRDAGDASEDQVASDVAADRGAEDASVDQTAVDGAADREAADAKDHQDAATIDDGAPDVTTACDAGLLVVYGPMQCTSDEQCVQLHIGNWCDTSGGITDACGHFTSWPTCSYDGGLPDANVDDGAPDVTTTCDAGMVVYYGPMQCTSDQECVQTGGPGYWCDTSAGFTDRCGRFTSWPSCRTDGGTPDARTDGATPSDSGED